MTIQIFTNGESRLCIDPMERGFHYGDGLFETMAIKQGEVPLWRYHWQRLSSSCERMGLPQPDQEKLEQRIASFCKGQDRAVLKLILSRGKGERGYRIPDNQQPGQAFYLSDWPDYDVSYSQKGIRVKICKTPLGMNPVLAGLKHLNRLEQIMARSEWQDDKFQEGIMLNAAGDVIEGTMTNLFWVKDEQIFTPDLSQCGVFGIMRQQILERIDELSMQIKIVSQPLDVLKNADEIFLTNSLIGVWPVQSIEDKTYAVGTITKKIQQLVQ
ncbi:MAG: aminodeoxychorismate lyase [Gammaproteobacteria bacterium]|nr:aminodeoxychorismate lyase [Gammaproteobacteria bacterium]